MAVKEWQVKGLQMLRGTRAELTARGLKEGELAMETDTGRVYLGDGVNDFQDLPYFLTNFEPTPSPVANDFATDDWSTIASVAESGTADQYYNIGDTKTFTLTTGEEITVRIIGFNHDTLASGGTAGISIEMVDLLSTTYQYNSSSTNSGGWDASLLRSTLNSDVFATLPSDLQAVIKTVNKKTSTGYGATGVVDSEDKLFILSMAEIYSETAIRNNTSSSAIYNYADIYVQEGSQYEFYKNLIGDTDPRTACSDLRKYRNGSYASYWTRSPYLSSSNNIWYLNSSNQCINNNYASHDYGVPLGFCI